APAATAAKALPAWLNDSLRPIRRVKAAWPTIPREIAARPGPNTAALTCAAACEAATEMKPEHSGSKSDAAATAIAAVAITARFARVASMNPPAGVWAMMPEAVAIDITIPMLASSHF